jgi:hypothetical protein
MKKLTTQQTSTEERLILKEMEQVQMKERQIMNVR